MDEVNACRIIQRAWRKHIDVQVFKYYRDLISFSSQGNPSMMLRCINPNEAKLLDEAAGIHIRFRLMGENFPPNICYKIYTHRPIQDMCSNSPKDYTHPTSKKLQSKYVHNKINIKKNVMKESEGSWYKRCENNGWRLVSNRHLLSRKMSSASGVRLSSHLPTSKTFHHNKLQRKQDVEVKRKRRKIEWMQKMYKKGMLSSKENDLNMTELVSKAAEGIVNTYNIDGQDHVQDWEVDELLQWTNGLNFDDYQKCWKQTGTSAPSDENYFINQQLRGGGDDMSTSISHNIMSSSSFRGDGDMRTSNGRLSTSTGPPNSSPRSDYAD